MLVINHGLIFTQVGPQYAKQVIRGIKQIDNGSSPTVEIKSGGIGSEHVVMNITSQYGKPLATSFEFYGHWTN